MYFYYKLVGEVGLSGGIGGGVLHRADDETPAGRKADHHGCFSCGLPSMVNPEAGGRGVSLVLTWADGSCRRPADGLAPPFRPREIWHCSSPPVNQRAITPGLQSCGSFPLCGMRPDFHRPEESRNAPNHPQQAQHHPLHICTVIIDFKADFRPVGAFYGELRGFGPPSGRNRGTGRRDC